jgi:uncharacterized glyoxalase superfamily protein PhnB
VKLPPACPEVPVAELGPALEYYRDRFGFTIDWADDSIGLAGLSRGETRLFMGDAKFRASLGTAPAPILLWLNLDNRDAVDALHREWAENGADIVAPPGPRPYKLHEFVARDLDGNFWRVFYDFGWEEREGDPEQPV